jgi:Family of unknown function (DUF6015)
MIITLKILKKAIQNKMMIDEENARKDAESVLDFFGFQDRILDNTLEPTERQIFYELEKAGILSSERETVNLSNSREWILHYWLVNKKKIIQYAQESKIIQKNILPKKQAIKSIYETITETMWNTRKIHE